MKRSAPAVQCSWPHGCRARTKDPSGLCYNHRRYSAPFTDNEGRHVAGTRLMGSLSLSSTKEFQSRADNSRQCIENRPVLMLVDETNAALIPYEEDRVVWKGELRTVPIQDRGNLIDTAEFQGTPILHVKLNGDKDDAIQELRHAQGAYMDQILFPQHSMFDGAGEEYDDDAEALAQFDLGSKYNSSVVVIDPDGSNPGDEIIKVTPKDQRVPAFQAVLHPVYPAITKTQEIVTAYGVKDIKVDGGKPLDDDQMELLSRLVGYRNLISQYGRRNPANGKLALPIGWNQQPLHEFVR